MLAKPILFLSSLSPGLLVVAFRLLPESLLLGLIVLACSVVLFPAGLITTWIRSRQPPTLIHVVAVKNQTFQVPTYVMTFIFPFLFINVDDLWTVAAYAVFLVLIGLLLSKSDVSIVNPGLILRGYQLFVATVEGENKGQTRDIMIISKEPPPLDEISRVNRLANETYFLTERSSS